MPRRNGGDARAGAEEVRGIISLPFYDPRSCRRIIEYARSADAWGDAAVTGEETDGVGGRRQSVRPEYRSASSFVPPSGSPLRREFDEKIKRLVMPLVRSAWAADLKRHHATHLVRYSPGDYYVAHTDVVPGNRHYRYFTLLCYLNDDFKGGRTSFPLLNYSFKPRAGRALLFPSTYLHRAEPVAQGEKYVIVTWLTGPPPISWL